MVFRRTNDTVQSTIFLLFNRIVYGTTFLNIEIRILRLRTANASVSRALLLHPFTIRYFIFRTYACKFLRSI